MSYRTHRSMHYLLLLVACSASAGDVTINACKWPIVNALNRMEIKGASALEIIEVKIDKPIDYIFGERRMAIVPEETWFRQQIKWARNPKITKSLRANAFEETRFISDVPSENFTSLLENNALYTYIIQDKKISLAKAKPGKIRDFASKHGLLSSDPDAGSVRMAGELWKDEKGVLHFNQGSGTYTPDLEDLKRAETFFKEHMGMKDAVSHIFVMPEAPVAVSKTTKVTNQLTKKLKQIENIQKTIIAKRYLVSGMKTSAVSAARMKQKEQVEGEKITLINPQGQNVQYEFRQMKTLVQEGTFFDTEDLKLHQQHNQLRTGNTFDLLDEKNIQKRTNLNENDHAVKSARYSGIGNAQLVPVAIERKEIIQYGLYPVNVPKGKNTTAAFIMSLETKTSTGLVNHIKGKEMIEYTASIEDLSTGQKTRELELDQLTKQIQNRFSLTEASPTNKSGGDLVSILETNVGQ